MNSQKQEQSKQQSLLLQQQQTSNSQQQYFGINGQLGNIAAPVQSQPMYIAQPQQQQSQQQQQQQQSQQQLKTNNNMNTNKSFTNFLSGVNDHQNLQQSQAQSALLQQQQAQLSQSTQGNFQVKNLQITSFSIKIIEGKLKLANSVDLRPLVQVQFGKRIWRTQTNKGSYPKWNEEKRFEIFNKGFDLNNNSGGACSSSSTTQSSCSSISPQPSQNQQNQIFQQQQLINGMHLPGAPAGYVDWNIEIVVLHQFQNEEIEKINRCSCLSGISYKIIAKYLGQCRFKSLLSTRITNSKLTKTLTKYTSIRRTIRNSSNPPNSSSNSQTNIHSTISKAQKPQQQQQQQSQQQQQAKQQSSTNSTNMSTLNQTPIQSNNKRNASSHSETSSFQDFQYLPQTTSRLVSAAQNYPDQQAEPAVQKLQMSYSTNLSNQPFRQIDMSDLLNQLQQENEMLMNQDKRMTERLAQAQSESLSVQKEQQKLEQSQNNIKLQESHLKQKQSGLVSQKDDFEKKLSKLEESKKILDSYIHEYQNLVAEEQDILKSNTKIKSDIKLINEEEPQVQDTLNTLSKKNNSEILQLKIFKLKMINHLKEINSIFYNRKPILVNKGSLKSHHSRAKSYSNHVSFGVDTVTDYSVALKNLQNKIQDITLVINNKNFEIESLREQIIKIESNNYDQC